MDQMELLPQYIYIRYKFVVESSCFATMGLFMAVC